MPSPLPSWEARGGEASPLTSWEKAKVKGIGAAKGCGPANNQPRPSPQHSIIRILVHTFNKISEYLSPNLLTTNTSVLF